MELSLRSKVGCGQAQGTLAGSPLKAEGQVKAAAS